MRTLLGLLAVLVLALGASAQERKANLTLKTLVLEPAQKTEVQQKKDTSPNVPGDLKTFATDLQGIFPGAAFVAEEDGKKLTVQIPDFPKTVTLTNIGNCPTNSGFAVSPRDFLPMGKLKKELEEKKGNVELIRSVAVAWTKHVHPWLRESGVKHATVTAKGFTVDLTDTPAKKKGDSKSPKSRSR